MVLALTSQQVSEMSAHAERVYPEECCGLMLGEIKRQTAATNSEVSKRIVEIVALENRWESDSSDANALDTNALDTNASDVASETQLTKHRRYTIEPRDMLRVQKQAREQGLSIIGIYHSHPDHAAVPSECDRAQAWPDYAYTIVSVRKGVAVDVQNWALDFEHQFQPEAMQIIPSSATDRMPVSA